MIKFQKGALLVEILVAALVLGTILLVTATALGVAFDGITSGTLQSVATFLLQEELEPLLTIRDKGWSNVTDGTYFFVPLGSSWQLVSTQTGETVGQFTRKIVLSDAYRDSNGQIVSSGGTLDPSTKKAVATVSWQGFLSHTLSATVYITRYKDNLIWKQTDKADFDLGTLTHVTTQYTGSSVIDGEVILAAGGGGNWCVPQPITAEFDLPKNGVANAVTAIEGRVFAGTGDNASGVSFANVTISNTNPPVASLAGTFDGYKTNGVFGESNYAYLATDNNFKEVVIIDLTQVVNGKYVEAGSFNAPGNGNGNSVFVTNSYGYMTSSINNKFYNFNKIGSNLSLDADGVALDGPGNKIYIVGNYAYIAIGATSNQIDIIDLSNPSNLTIVGRATVDGQGATDVFVNSSATRAYLVTSASSTQKEFFILDITTKTGNSHTTLGSYEASGMSPKGVRVVTGGRALIVGTGGEEYQTINISNEANPTRCGGMDVSTGVNGIDSVLEADGDAYSYIVTGDVSSELKIILGGPGGKFSASGTFESSTFDPGSQTAFNRFTAHFDKPSQTDIQFQVAVADVGSDGTCVTATFTFIGPDGTSATYFTTTTSPFTGGIPFGSSSGRCFRYRAYLTTSDTTQTPTLNDFSVSYAP